MNISVNVVIKSPKKQVWKTIIDIDNSVNIISGITNLKVLHQPDTGIIGFKWVETRKMFGKESSETMWITESKHEEYYCTRAENCGAIYTTKMAVTEDAEGTRLSMSFSGTASSWWVRALSSVMGLLMKKPMAKMLKKDLEEIKAYIERDE